MSLACSEDELKQLLNDIAFTRNFGFVLHGIADRQCRIDVPFQDAFERPGGLVSGQVFMAAADVAMWLAIKTQLGLTDSSVTTASIGGSPPRPIVPVTVTVSGVPAMVQYAGGAPGQVAGLMQVNVLIPAGFEPGGYVPVVLRVGDVSTTDGAVWIAVARK
jgi:hypothetical protein